MFSRRLPRLVSFQTRLFSKKQTPNPLLVDILEEKITGFPVTTIQSLGPGGFEVNNHIVSQPMIVFKECFLLWDINSIDDISYESLAAVSIYLPIVEVLLIGVGENVKFRLSKELAENFRKRGTVVEMSSTFHAASTFNILASEGRNVAAALIPEEYQGLPRPPDKSNQ